MRRFMLVLAGVTFFVTAFAGPATATARSACATSAAATYRHTFHGAAGTATITAVVPLCAGQSQAFSLVSYTVGASAQFVYDSDHAVVDASHRTVALDVAVPACTAQVDAIFGSAVLTEVSGTAGAYGTVRLGSASGTGHRSTGSAAWYSGGRSACAPQPSVTFTSGCDGGFTATLANRAAATVTAVFVADGATYRVKPGARTTVVADAGGSLTVRDNTFKTTSGTWSMPAVCTQPTTTPTSNTIPASPTLATTPTSAAPATSSAAPVSSPAAAPITTPSATETLAVAGGATFQPAATAQIATADADEALAVTGSGAGSVALIALGVLLIGGGMVILGRQIYRARHAN